ncbi:hypothetical protein [Peribacillus frigoritolerans]|uniref:hypothetical protein n=1 Tax=Peribacillus castrilensis TaxID=2897690 RepID=UPI00296ED627|nr:hypothetical protein [Peribacillus castrilensis]
MFEIPAGKACPMETPQAQAEADRPRKASALRSNQRSYFIYSQKMQAIVCLQSEPIIQLIGFYFSNEG